MPVAVALIHSGSKLRVESKTMRAVPPADLRQSQRTPKHSAGKVLSGTPSCPRMSPQARARRACRCGKASGPPPPDLPLSLAVAASSCFPPVFKPLRMGLGPAKLAGGKVPQGAERDSSIRGLTLSDGGVYDNLALESVWKDHAVVLSSGGGALIRAGADTGFFWEVERETAVPENQALAVRRRWLMANFIGGIMEGTYWASAARHRATAAAGDIPRRWRPM
jgi:predicted acylesterase/phospholipase RssA